MTWDDRHAPTETDAPHGSGSGSGGAGAEDIWHLFENAPVSLWREDFSQVKAEIEALAAQGVTDFETYFQAHPEVVQACAEKVVIQDVNRATLALHEAESKAQLLASLIDCFTEQSYETFRDQLTALAQGETVFEAEGVVRTLSGASRHVLVKFFRDPAREDWSIVYVAVIDLSAAREAEAARQEFERRLTASHRLESLAVLAGGVAHDFSNLLMVIQGNVHVALAEAEPGGNLEESLLEIQAATERASVLSKQMLAYAGRSRLTQQVHDLNELVAALPSEMAPGFSTQARLHMMLSEGRLELLCDAARIAQVLRAMVTNAAESGATRVVTIEVRSGALTYEDSGPVEASEAGPDHHVPLPGALEVGRRYVYVDVKDDGCGMEQDVRARMFDPFFSTKAPGRGLGMAIVLGLVRAHGGALQVCGAPGQGTTVRVLLPALEAKESG